MISSAAASNLVDTVSEGSTPAASGQAATSGKGAFDAILALENLAATCNSLDPIGLEGVVEGLSEADGEGDERDSEDEDGELGALEFLAALLNAPTHRPQVPAGQESGGQAADTAGSISPQAARSEPGAGLALMDLVESKKATDASPVATNAVDGLTTSRDGTVDPSAQIARSAELLTQGPRLATGPERAGIATSMRDPRWAEDFGARVTMMVRGGESQASLQLSPVDLGPMDVSVTVKDSQASIHFGAAQAETRALIEASIPRLREMLAAQGFHLMDASVSQGFSRQAQPGQAATGGRVQAESDGEAVVTRVTANGLLDLYA